MNSKKNIADCPNFNLQFIPGIPSKDGWYLVRLIPGHVYGDKKYDVDYCRKKSLSDGGGGGREWVKWYPHNISHYAELPKTKNERNRHYKGRSNP